MAVALGFCLVSQTASEAQTGAETVSLSRKAPIVLDGRELFYVGGLKGFTAAERTAFANQVLRDQMKRTPSDKQLRVWRLERRSLLTLRVTGAAGSHLLTLTEQDLMAGMTIEEQAERWTIELQEALDKAQYERTNAYRQQMAGRILLWGLAVSGLYLLLRWRQRRLRRHRDIAPMWRRLWAETGHVLVQWGAWLGFAVWVTGLFPEVRSMRYPMLEFLKDTFTSNVVTLGGQGYSVLEVGKILALMLVLWLVVRGLTRLFRARVLQVVGAGREVQDAIALLIQISLTGLGLLVMLQAFGVDVSSLAILVSVIGVGVGFGLQNIANNFISGIIIMLERPVQVGDFVKLGDLTGTVERIGIRSTEISTLDRVSIIVPNSEFIDTKVINWSHGYPVSRLHIPLGVAYGSPIKRVRQVVLDAAKRHPQVLRYPKPQLWFEGFGDSSLDFKLLVWIREPRLQARIKSDLYYLLEDYFRRCQIEIPFPQRDLHVRSKDMSALANALSSNQDSQRSEAATTAASWLSHSSELNRPTYEDDSGDGMDWSDILRLTDEPSEPEIQDLISEMRGPSGVDIRDRRFGLHRYRQCFIGSEAVQWFTQHQLASREEAVRLGQILVERGIIHHVTDEHNFKDAYLFYRFYKDEASTDSSK